MRVIIHVDVKELYKIGSIQYVTIDQSFDYGRHKHIISFTTKSDDLVTKLLYLKEEQLDDLIMYLQLGFDDQTLLNVLR